MTSAGTTSFADKKQAIVFLRWVLILATSYVVLLGDHGTTPWASLYVAAFLATNLAAIFVSRTAFEELWLQATILLFDTAWIALGMVLSGSVGADLFLLYCAVLFVAALGENLSMIAGGCVLIALLDTASLLRTQPASVLLESPVLLRVPFLFAIGAFYGYLVTVAKEERRRAEEAVAQERLRTDFLALVTHDLQSPLAAIVGFADLLAEDESLRPEERTRIASIIRNAAGEASELVGSFLSMTRGEATGPVGRDPVEVADLVAEVGDLHRAIAQGRDIRIVSQVAPEIPPLRGDRSGLRRALANLVSNALKFTPTGGTVEIGASPGKNTVRLWVVDSGKGIEPEVASRLFERYSTGDAGGIGLGLFIVRLVVEGHGGTIRADSPPGRGARFTLEIPVGPEPADGSRAPSPH